MSSKDTNNFPCDSVRPSGAELNLPERSSKNSLCVAGATQPPVAAIDAPHFKTLRNFGIFFVGDLVAGLVMSLFVINLGINTAAGGVALGLAIWVGVSVTGGSARNAANDKPMSAFLLDAGHELLAIVAMCTILGAWRA